MTLVAKVASMRDFSSSSMLEMMVWDGTGSFNVHYYIPEEDEQVCKPLRLSCRSSVAEEAGPAEMMPACILCYTCVKGVRSGTAYS